MLKFLSSLRARAKQSHAICKCRLEIASGYTLAMTKVANKKTDTASFYGVTTQVINNEIYHA
jgi:hypothetical protein